MLTDRKNRSRNLGRQKREEWENEERKMPGASYLATQPVTEKEGKKDIE